VALRQRSRLDVERRRLELAHHRIVSLDAVGVLGRNIEPS
jgi:hypothetical protein